MKKLYILNIISISLIPFVCSFKRNLSGVSQIYPGKTHTIAARGRKAVTVEEANEDINATEFDTEKGTYDDENYVLYNGVSYLDGTGNPIEGLEPVDESIVGIAEGSMEEAIEPTEESIEATEDTMEGCKFPVSNLYIVLRRFRSRYDVSDERSRDIIDNFVSHLISKGNYHIHTYRTDDENQPPLFMIHFIHYKPFEYVRDQILNRDQVANEVMNTFYTHIPKIGVLKYHNRSRIKGRYTPMRNSYYTRYRQYVPNILPRYPVFNQPFQPNYVPYNPMPPQPQPSPPHIMSPGQVQPLQPLQPLQPIGMQQPLHPVQRLSFN